MKHMNSQDYYLQGNQYRREGNFQQAMNSYMEALALDPDSPAKESLKMLTDIMNFYHKDAYNP